MQGLRYSFIGAFCWVNKTTARILAGGVVEWEGIKSGTKFVGLDAGLNALIRNEEWKMDILVIAGFILAVINPVIGGVLVGYIVWLSEPAIGFQIMMLALTVFSLFVIGFIVWASKKIRKLEQALASVEGKSAGV